MSISEDVAISENRFLQKPKVRRRSKVTGQVIRLLVYTMSTMVFGMICSALGPSIPWLAENAHVAPETLGWLPAAQAVMCIVSGLASSFMAFVPRKYHHYLLCCLLMWLGGFFMLLPATWLLLKVLCFTRFLVWIFNIFYIHIFLRLKEPALLRVNDFIFRISSWASSWQLISKISPGVQHIDILLDLGLCLPSFASSVDWADDQPLSVSALRRCQLEQCSSKLQPRLGFPIFFLFRASGTFFEGVSYLWPRQKALIRGIIFFQIFNQGNLKHIQTRKIHHGTLRDLNAA